MGRINKVEKASKNGRTEGMMQPPSGLCYSSIFRESLLGAHQINDWQSFVRCGVHGGTSDTHSTYGPA